MALGQGYDVVGIVVSHTMHFTSGYFSTRPTVAVRYGLALTCVVINMFVNCSHNSVVNLSSRTTSPSMSSQEEPYPFVCPSKAGRGLTAFGYSGIASFLVATLQILNIHFRILVNS